MALRAGRVEKKKKRLKKKAIDLADLVVKNGTLRVPCGGRITRLIADRKKLSLTLWSAGKLLKEKNRKAAKEKTLIDHLLSLTD